MGLTVDGLDLHVLITLTDDFVGVDDIVQERIERTAANTRQIGPNGRTLSVQLVADQTRFDSELVPRLQVHRPIDHHLSLGGDALKDLRAGSLETPEQTTRLLAFIRILRTQQRAHRRGRNVGLGDLSPVEGVVEGPLPGAPGGGELGGGRAHRRGHGLPMHEQLAGGFVVARLGQHPDGGHSKRIGRCRTRQAQES